MIIASKTFGMGDILLLTAVAKHCTDAEVHLPPEANKFSRFFRDICKQIIITDNIVPMPESGYDHYALRKLRAVGLAHKCYLPYVSVSEDEKQHGLELIKPYNNPIVFVGNSSSHWKHEREPHKEYFQNIIDNLIKTGRDVLQFGLSSNFTKFSNTIPLIDLDIDTLIKYYSAIGEYVGVDTGDTHLMLATGGKCKVHIPRHGSRLPMEWNYNYPNIIQYTYFN
jgi:hypothetical protein